MIRKDLAIWYVDPEGGTEKPFNCLTGLCPRQSDKPETAQTIEKHVIINLTAGGCKISWLRDPIFNRPFKIVEMPDIDIKNEMDTTYLKEITTWKGIATQKGGGAKVEVYVFEIVTDGPEDPLSFEAIHPNTYLDIETGILRDLDTDEEFVKNEFGQFISLDGDNEIY